MALTMLGLCISAEPGVAFAHSPWIAAVSFGAAALGSQAALEMAERSVRPNAFVWRLASAATLATAIWCMHFLGILAITEPLPVGIAPGPTLLSLAVAIAAVMLGFLCVKPKSNRWHQFLGAGVLVGLGIVLMHFIGMAGVLLPVPVAYQPWLGGVSVGIAVTAATAGLSIAHRFHNRRLRPAAAAVMATAICGMHYTAMAAATMPVEVVHSFAPSFDRMLLVGAITAAIACLLLLALVSNASDRRLMAAEVSLLRDANAMMVRTQEEFLRRLASVAETRDTDTGQHITRIGTISQQLAIAAGCTQEYAHQISLAAMLHDIGKIGIADSILLKREPLTAEERQDMRRHAELGHDMLAGSGLPLLDMAAEISWCHHECWDGSGYPRGLRAEEIPLAARIVAISDVADALLSPRPYKQPWTLERVLEHLAADGGIRFDPHLVDVLLESVAPVLAVWLSGPIDDGILSSAHRRCHDPGDGPATATVKHLNSADGIAKLTDCGTDWR